MPHARILQIGSTQSDLDTDNNTSHSFNFTLDNGGQDRVVFLALGQLDAAVAAAQASSITFNGSAMTNIAVTADTDAADDPGVELWYYRVGQLVAGSYAIVITYAANMENSQAVAFCLSGIDYVTLNDATAEVSNGTTSPGSDSITTITDRALVIQVLCSQTTTLHAPSNGQTELFDADFNAVAALEVSYLEVETPGVTTVGSTFGPDDWAMILAAIRPRRRKTIST